MKRLPWLALGLSAGLVWAQAKLPPPPEVIFRPSSIRTDERPVQVDVTRETVADDGLYRRVEASIVFTNPNGRIFEGELEFPLPDGATVCGYELEVNGRMVKGVVCEKDKARTAFDNEKKHRVDPGLVEHVKGNLWKTRVYPLFPRTPRKAKLVYIEPLAGEPLVVAERDGDEVFVGERSAVPKTSAVAERLRTAATGWILWDASLSRYRKTAADLNLLQLLPAKGDWTLVIFRDAPEAPRRFADRDELIAAVRAAPCDGATSFEALAALLPAERRNLFLFSDETDTLSERAPDLEKLGVIFASRPEGAERTISVRKLATGEKAPCEVKEGGLLATAWAADRIADLAAQADQRKEEFLALGRKYGVASPVTSLIVLESLDQYLKYRIEPPADLPFYDAWKQATQFDGALDPVADERRRTDHLASLLGYWEERVRWWNDPKPQVPSPKSGVFGDEPQYHVAVSLKSTSEAGIPRHTWVRSSRSQVMAMGMDRGGSDESSAAEPQQRCLAEARPLPPAPSSVMTVKLAKWDPATPYLKRLDRAVTDDPYAVYLQVRDDYLDSPSFYLDCAGWFFHHRLPNYGCRIISNLAEMKLEDVDLWRTMGWRLREAEAYELAVLVFRHVLAMRPEEPQSRRDLALVLTERGKAKGNAEYLNEAARLLKLAAFEPTRRESGRFGNDMQTCVLALEELNGLIAWCAANPKLAAGFVPPEIPKAYAQHLPLDLRITMSWDTDETDVDLHVLEPNGEESFFGHRRTASGGFLSQDVTTGYGPEEYLQKSADKGKYVIKARYYASHRQALTGAATISATVYTGWGTANEKRQVFSFRLNGVQDVNAIGEVTVE